MQSMAQVKKLWSSGMVNRWHTNSDPRLRNSGDTNDAHSARVAKLVYAFAGATHSVRDDVDLYNAMEQAILHDCPEKVTGDVGYETKRKVPEMRHLLADMDDKYWSDLGLAPLPRDLDPIVVLADQVDALLLCQLNAPDLWKRNDWRNHAEKVLGMAAEIGLAKLVTDLIYGGYEI